MSNYNCGIYRIRNLVNDKCIYGSSQNIRKRWKQHRSNLINQRHENIIVQRAWNKYGEDKFVFERVEKCSIEELKIVEQKYIDGNIGGYNIAPAQGGDILSNHPNRKEIIERRTETQRKTVAQMSNEERKEKFSKPKESNPNYKDGRSYKKKSCPKCGTMIKLKSKTCSSCNKSGGDNPFHNKTHSQETKAILRNKKLGIPLCKSAREKITGEQSPKFQGYYHTPWGVFPSSNQAQNAHPYLKSNTINTWCKNSSEIITKSASTKSRFWRENGGHKLIGKTKRSLGFWFEPKRP